MENEIDANLDALSGAAKRLHLLAKATGDEVDRQNPMIDGITAKVTRFLPHLHHLQNLLKSNVMELTETLD